MISLFFFFFRGSFFGRLFLIIKEKNVKHDGPRGSFLPNDGRIPCLYGCRVSMCTTSQPNNYRVHCQPSYLDEPWLLFSKLSLVAFLLILFFLFYSFTLKKKQKNLAYFFQSTFYFPIFHLCLSLFLMLLHQCRNTIASIPSSSQLNKTSTISLYSQFRVAPFFFTPTSGLTIEILTGPWFTTHKIFFFSLFFAFRSTSS